MVGKVLLAGVLLLLPLRGGDNLRIAAPTSEKSDVLNARPTLDVLLYNGKKDVLFDLKFHAEATSGEGFGRGVWLRGVGRAVNSSGKVVIANMTVDLRIRVRQAAQLTFELQQNSIGVFKAGDAMQFVRVRPATIQGAGRATTVDFGRQMLAEFELSAEWQGWLDPSDTAAVLGELYRLLGGGGGVGDGEVECDPTWEECWERAVRLCGDRGVHSVSYSCNPETGEVTCAFECGSGGPD